jgi:hypothetical protein
MKAAFVAVVLGVGPAALAAPAADTIHAPRAVKFGGHVVISGRFATAPEGQPVEIRFRGFGDPSFATLALVPTDANGRWHISTEPAIATKYEAAWLTNRAGPISVGVRPLVTLRRRGQRFVVGVRSSATYQNRYVLLQRRVGRRWKKVAKVVLRRRPRRFDASLPRGRSRVRAFLPASQAGAGYLPSASVVVVVRR